jgi:hypothetical protein
MNYRSSEGSGKRLSASQKPGFQIKEDNNGMKSFRSRERSGSWGSHNLSDKKEKSDFGSAFMNITRKSGILQAFGIGEDKVSEIMPNASYTMDEQELVQQ